MIPCPKCKGNKTYGWRKLPCTVCKGVGEIEEPKKQNVSKLPPKDAMLVATALLMMGGRHR